MDCVLLLGITNESKACTRKQLALQASPNILLWKRSLDAGKKARRIKTNAYPTQNVQGETPNRIHDFCDQLLWELSESVGAEQPP